MTSIKMLCTGTCSEIDQVGNGTVDGDLLLPQIDTNNITVLCDFGYYLEPNISQLQCLGSGEWSPVIVSPLCLRELIVSNLLVGAIPCTVP